MLTMAPTVYIIHC